MKKKTATWNHKLNKKNVFRNFKKKKKKKKPSSFASVCMPVRMEQPGSHWTDFHEIWYLRVFRKIVEKAQVLLKSDKN
jgi:hypothetical protein